MPQWSQFEKLGVGNALGGVLGAPKRHCRLKISPKWLCVVIFRFVGAKLAANTS
jgi:hypothetical protein